MSKIARFARTRVACTLLIVLAVGALGGRASAARGEASSSVPANGHWVAQDSLTASDIHGIACPSAAVCYASAAQGIIVGTADGGRTWNPLLSAAAGGVWAIACPSVSRCITGSETDFHILLTRDGGRTWDLAYQPELASEPQFDSDGTNNYYFHGMYGATCATATACFIGYIFRTADGGATWSIQTGAPYGQSAGTSRQSVLGDVSCIPSAGVCYAVGFICNCAVPYGGVLTAGAIAVSTDGGRSWRSRTVANGLQSVSCLDARTCVAVGVNGVILRTTDGGRSWPSVPNPLSGGRARLNQVICVGGVCRAVGDYGSVLLSTDGGRSWHTERVPTAAGLDVIACPRANLCYIGGAGGVILKGS